MPTAPRAAEAPGPTAKTAAMRWRSQRQWPRPPWWSCDLAVRLATAATARPSRTRAGAEGRAMAAGAWSSLRAKSMGTRWAHPFVERSMRRMRWRPACDWGYRMGKKTATLTGGFDASPAPAPCSDRSPRHFQRFCATEKRPRGAGQAADRQGSVDRGQRLHARRREERSPRGHPHLAELAGLQHRCAGALLRGDE